MSELDTSDMTMQKINLVLDFLLYEMKCRFGERLHNEVITEVLKNIELMNHVLLMQKGSESKNDKPKSK